MPNPRPLTQLVHFPVQQGTDDTSIITLHDHSQFGRDVEAWATIASPHSRVVCLESYKGVFVARDIVGYTWFLGPEQRPSPIFFGDALSEIERFLWDEVDRAPAGTIHAPYLLGVGQGGIMALATALAVPELVSGVIAIDAFLPIVGGWNPPLAPMDKLPVLLVNPRPSDDPKVLAGPDLAKQLKNWDAVVQTEQHPNLSPATLNINQWIRKYGPKVIERSPTT